MILENIDIIMQLKKNDSNFLLSSMLGILHHQRPGFLSYPSSHTVPYLRKNTFPPKEYPELYLYRSVKDRLIKKVRRAFKRIPLLDNKINRVCIMEDAKKSIISGIKLSPVILCPNNLLNRNEFLKSISKN